MPYCFHILHVSRNITREWGKDRQIHDRWSRLSDGETTSPGKLSLFVYSWTERPGYCTQIVRTDRNSWTKTCLAPITRSSLCSRAMFRPATSVHTINIHVCTRGGFVTFQTLHTGEGDALLFPWFWGYGLWHGHIPTSTTHTQPLKPSHIKSCFCLLIASVRICLKQSMLYCHDMLFFASWFMEHLTFMTPYQYIMDTHQ